MERKTAIDFVQSIIDGRLFRQAKRMKNYVRWPLFIVEGENLCTGVGDMHPHAIKGAIVNLALIWQIPVLFSTSKENTAEWLWLIARQQIGSESAISGRHGRRPKRPYNRQMYILQGLPGIGPKLAHELLVSFGRVEKVMSATEKELASVRGLSKIKAARIRTILTQEVKV